MSHLSHDDALLLFLLSPGELGWPDEDFAVILRASQRTAASARHAGLGGDLIRVVLEARPGLLGEDWSGRMTAAAAQGGVGSSGNMVHCGGVGSSPGMAACAMARCTRATGTAMDGEMLRTHEKRRRCTDSSERAGGEPEARSRLGKAMEECDC
jgi:hypothetical protein